MRSGIYWLGYKLAIEIIIFDLAIDAMYAFCSNFII